MNGNNLGGFVPGLPIGFGTNTSNGSGLRGMGSITMMQANAALLGSSDPKLGGLQGFDASQLAAVNAQAQANLMSSLNPTNVSSMGATGNGSTSSNSSGATSSLVQQQQAIIARQQELLMAQQFRKPAVVPSQKLMNSILPKPSAAGTLSSAGNRSSLTNDAQQAALTSRNIQNYLNLGIVQSRSNLDKNAPGSAENVAKGIANGLSGRIADLNSMSLASMSSLLVEAPVPTVMTSSPSINKIPTTLTNLRSGENNTAGSRDSRKHQRQEEDDELPPPSDMPSLLHQACHLYPDTTSVVLSALRCDPGSVRRRVFTSVSAGTDKTSGDNLSNNGDAQRKKKAKTEGCHYPINIALWSRASEEIIKLLAKEGRDVLNKKDGPEDCNALMNALYRYNPKAAQHTLKMIAILLKYGSNKLLEGTDRYKNLPLHVACLKGCNADFIQLLVQLNPPALCARNFHQQTPLDVAQRSQLCSDDVIDYLQKASFGCFEEQADHLDDVDATPVAVGSGGNVEDDDDDPLASLDPFSL
uniref:ANK_REP_REGION domain-containing protein n=1 Tax=Grammatophora oceanica TaxID=210454 RepID=A0A7S1UTZ5_9STRA|mmetsp:Transcript_22716/g.33693  ORF Transcript_22716/g.33693 Transcript_22716/m.33693 type:complete len:528 (+) Transcript_22716:466-2049(+)|eukprot:CAMPEP_0194031614 /NCGR_PEP_ID=MMETSP0009_2-20130614/4751_1 /TAXON_ID=210454 /ORGANISM="Grammatophora oceanica, Strain CCMP 410" /LENGTH=527 /DNA_ID=CAMNT_0038671823 /DNA_START=466 /DNA_END=2049 /DNA_ORIENTATION=+